MLEPRLEVAGTGLDDGARSEAVSGKLRERDLGEIAENRVAMSAGWTDVDVRATDVALLEQGKSSDHSFSRSACSRLGWRRSRPAKAPAWAD